MNPKRTSLILLGITLLAVVAGAIAYPFLPERIASHWNAAGEADGSANKLAGVFLAPLLMAGMYLVYALIPRIDPLRQNIESFRHAYDAFWIWLFVFFAYVFGLSMAWNLGYRFNFTAAMVPAIAVLLYIIGGVFEKSKRNWFLGIRTPWTLSSDTVWDKTHRIGGKLFKIAAAISLIGIFLPESYAIAAIAVPAAVAAIVAVVYSYLEFKKENAL